MNSEITSIVGEESAEEILHLVKRHTSVLNIVVPTTIEECMDRVTFLVDRQFCDAAEMGFILLHVKHKAKHGEFSKLLEKRNVKERTARRAMAIAKMLMALPESKTAKLAVLNLNQTQLAELSSVPIETLKELDDEDYEVLAETSGNAIKKQVAELLEKKSELEDSQAELINELEQERLRKT
ncbi:hypothetical protein VSO74_24625, partial [Pseudoalteromonas rubra]|nr:hypothetical protein [Pseudoalteromonas rubra]